MSPDPWKTAVSWAEPDRILIRGYRMRDLIGRVSFGQTAYLLLVGELPEENVGQIVEAILVSVAAHGPDAPSAKAAVTVAGAGAGLTAAVGAGVLAITRYHGGAIEDCMTVLEECVGMGVEPFEAATELVQRYRMRALRIAGFGSKRHPEDPRVTRLLEYAGEIGVVGPYVEQLRHLERAVGQATGRKLPINIDGAIASLLCEIHFPKAAANGLFLISRVAGLSAHAIEAQSRYRPLEGADAVSLEYDGPPERSL